MSFKKIMAHQYGGKTGAARLLLSRIAHLFGFYSSYEKVNYSRVRRLVFVCKGNVCRSPYGEWRARHQGLLATSAGLVTRNGKKANPAAIVAALKRSISLEEHLSRTMDSLVLDEGDLLLAFEPWQARALKEYQAKVSAQVTLVGLYLENQMPHLQDPYMLTEGYFQTCYERIDQAIENLALKIKA